MSFEKEAIQKVLVISLTNIGDVILTLPVLDILKHELSHAEISLVIGLKAKSLFDGTTSFKAVHIYDKHSPLSKKWSWSKNLAKEKYDLLIDLRNTFLPFLIDPKWSTPPMKGSVKSIHMKNKHLLRLKSVWSFPFPDECPKSLKVPPQIQIDLGKFLEEQKISYNFVALAPGAASADKRWPPKGFAILAEHIIEKHGYDVVFVGDESERYLIENVINQISDKNQPKAKTLAGRLSLIQLGALFQRSKMVVANDSGPSHLASYYDVPVLVLFGPTDPFFYGPWGKDGHYLREHKSGVSYVDGDDPATAIKKILPDQVKAKVDQMFS